MSIEQENKKTLKIILALVITCLSLIIGLFGVEIYSNIKCNKSELLDNKYQELQNFDTNPVKIEVEAIKSNVFNNTKVNRNLLEEEFYKERIPKEYANAFLYYTRNHKSIRIYFYSIMVHESCNFTVFKHKNRDGSIDWGPSQLNSKNLQNAYFREFYRPKEESHITSRFCYYMVMTINLYVDLVSKYGYDYAFYAYNGGEKAIDIIKHNRVTKENDRYVTAIKTYNRSVMRNVNKYTSEMNLFVSSRTDEIKNNAVAKIMFGLENLFFIEEIDNKSYVSFKHVSEFGNKLLIYIRKKKPFDFSSKETFIFTYNALISALYVYS